jgi:type IV pilus assembly protein PilF
MGRILLLLGSIIVLSGCVTEKTFIDSKKQVRSFDFNKDEASKTRLVLALSYLENGNYEQAKFNLEKALAFSPERADVNYSLGYYYQTVGEMAIAETYYLKAIDLEPQNPNTLNNYGTFLCNVGQLDKAADYFKRAIAISKYTRAADSYENLAICALTNNKILQAQEYFEMSYKHNPGRPYNLLSLSGIKYATGDLVAALDFYNRYQRLSVPTARSLLLGHILESRRGRITQADEYIAELVEKFPNSREALYVSTQSIQNSEFEQLRKQYQAQYGSGPKVKITRKSPSNQSLSVKNVPSQKKVTNKFGRDDNLTGLVLPATISSAVKKVSTTAEFAQELQQKVAMFSKPLTDTESVVLPEVTQSTVALPKEMPLPEEKVLTESVKPAVLVNDRASTKNTRVYLEPNPQELTVPTYQVQAGDNLYRVSVKFNIRVDKLVEWNALNKQEVSVGQTLFIANPEPIVEIQSETTLSDLANQFRVELAALLSWNGLSEDGWLKPGQKVLITDPELYNSMSEMSALKKVGEELTLNPPKVTVPIHKVKSGEFLYKISKKYNVKLNALIRWNRLSANAKLVIGQKLYVKNPNIFYIASKTTTLSDVGKLLGISLKDLQTWNQVDADGVVNAGTKVLIVNPELYK